MKRNKKSNILFWQPKVCYYIIDFLFFWWYEKPKI
jgi:hypothetical protein